MASRRTKRRPPRKPRVSRAAARRAIREAAYKKAVEKTETHAYRMWRNKILDRDDHRCQMCGKKRLKLEVHHIQRKKDRPDLVLIETNVITLCRVCHRTHVTGHEKRFQYVFQQLLRYRGIGG